jgi:hypothetical protein
LEQSIQLRRGAPFSCGSVRAPIRRVDGRVIAERLLHLIFATKNQTKINGVSVLHDLEIPFSRRDWVRDVL